LVRYSDKLIVVYEEQDNHSAWDIPAGGIESNETPVQAIRRELREEIGLYITVEPRLTAIFWAQLQTPTVHFLYEVEIDDTAFRSLAPHTSDIQRIDSFSRAELQKLIDTRAYEHNLAKARLELFLGDQNRDQQLVYLTD
jgi:8-oxo-dGTP pyrophosphatase MutT (NUDIX family)